MKQSILFLSFSSISIFGDLIDEQFSRAFLIHDTSLFTFFFSIEKFE